jgi:DNA helicase HerA-like ATPase
MEYGNEEDITLFAETNYRNKQQRFGIQRSDRRFHMFIIGKSGTGKSTLIENLILSDLRAGEGLALLDPHGDLLQKVLVCIPELRKADVIHFDPAATEPLGFNVLERSQGVQSHLVASGLISVFKKIWKDSWGPRLEHILRNTLLTLLEFRDTTLLDIPRLLVDKQFRTAIVSKLKDEQVRAFWLKEYEAYSNNFRTEAIAPIQNKVGQFLTNRLTRSIVEQKQSSFNIRQIMDEGKILLIDLSKGKIGSDTSSLLGALFLTQIELQALSRSDLAETNRRDFHVYIDELPNFATESFASMLSELRKYHVSLIAATQYLEQLNEELRSAIFGNVGTIISFRVGARDAEYLAKEFYPDVDQESLINLPNHQVYIKLMINGATSHAFSAKTLPSQMQSSSQLF